MTEAELIADRTTDAYSYDRYGHSEWVNVTQFLLDEGYDSNMTEEILRSKYTRWGADYGGPSGDGFKLAYTEESWFKKGITEMLIDEFGVDPSALPM